jgi:hypothetical protein
MNGYGKPEGCTERDAIMVDLYLYLAAALVHHRQFIRRARSCCRWDTCAAAPSG